MDFGSGGGDPSSSSLALEGVVGGEVGGGRDKRDAFDENAVDEGLEGESFWKDTGIVDAVVGGDVCTSGMNSEMEEAVGGEVEMIEGELEETVNERVGASTGCADSFVEQFVEEESIECAFGSRKAGVESGRSFKLALFLLLNNTVDEGEGISAGLSVDAAAA